MTKALLPYPRFRAFATNGTPLASGKVYTYESGTTTNKTTWSDAEETTANANPVILDAQGEATIYGKSGELYRIKVTDSLDNVLYTIDGVQGIPSTSNNTSLALNTASSTNNILVGGDFRANPWQMGTSFTAATTIANNDHKYIIDGWRLMSDENDIVDITQDTDGSAKFEVETTGSKFGIIQFIENKDILPILDNGACSLSIEMKSSASSAIRVGVMEWTSTKDTCTTDPINTWESTGVLPTLKTNWAFSKDPSNFLTSTSYQTFSVANITPSSSATNLAVFIFSDSTALAVDDTINIKRVQLNVGTSPANFAKPDAKKELERAQRYFEKSYDLSDAPGTATTTGSWQYYNSNGTLTSSTTTLDSIPFRVTKRTTPTVKGYSTSTGTLDKGRDETGGADVEFTASTIGDSSFWPEFDFSSNSLAAGDQLSLQWTAEAPLDNDPGESNNMIVQQVAGIGCGNGNSSVTIKGLYTGPAAADGHDHWVLPKSGNLLFAIVTSNDADATLTAPTGWTKVHDDDRGDGSLTRAAFWKASDGTESSTTWTSNGAEISVIQYEIEGADTSDPIDSYYIHDNSVNTSSLSLGPLTTTSDSVLFFISAVQSDNNPSGSTQTPTGYSGLDDFGTAASSFGKVKSGDSTNNTMTDVFHKVDTSRAGSFFITQSWSATVNAPFATWYAIKRDKTFAGFTAASSGVTLVQEASESSKTGTSLTFNGSSTGTAGESDDWVAPTLGNFLVMYVACRSADSADITTPTNWTRAALELEQNSSSLACFYKTSDGTESSITVSGNDHICAVVHEFSGVDTSNPYQTAVETTNSTTSVGIGYNPITNLTGNGQLIMAAHVMTSRGGQVPNFTEGWVNTENNVFTDTGSTGFPVLQTYYLDKQDNDPYVRFFTDWGSNPVQYASRSGLAYGALYAFNTTA